MAWLALDFFSEILFMTSSIYSDSAEYFKQNEGSHSSFQRKNKINDFFASENAWCESFFGGEDFGK